MFTYSQTTGKYFLNGVYLTTGYSGFEQGKNNPLLQDVHNFGPIPRGVFDIGIVHDDVKLGPCVMMLTPVQGTNVFGRTDFYEHGDDKKQPGFGSHGCIVVAYLWRMVTSLCVVKQVEVVL
jgi:hypothetical protein